MKIFQLIAALLGAISLAPAHAQTDDVNQMVTTVCSKCHERDGNSTTPRFPKLAGQQKGYLIAQLKAFRDQTRRDPDAHAYMWGISKLLDDAIIAKLSEYYSAQKPTRGTPGDARLAAKGKVIFEKGIKSKDVPACLLCHTRTAEGIGIVPRLAGQHQYYLVQQIKVFHGDDRPVYARIMKSAVESLSDEEAEQVAAYLQGL